MIPTRAYKYATIGVTICTLALFVSLVASSCRRESGPLVSPLDAMAQYAPAPACFLDSVDYENGYTIAWCNTPDRARLYLDLEARDENGAVVGERTVETFVFGTAITPTQTLSPTIDVSGLPNGNIFIRPRWGYSSWDEGIVGVYVYDGIIQEQDERGFVSFEIFRQYFPGVMAVIE